MEYSSLLSMIHKEPNLVRWARNLGELNLFMSLGIKSIHFNQLYVLRKVFSSDFRFVTVLL